MKRSLKNKDRDVRVLEVLVTLPYDFAHFSDIWKIVNDGQLFTTKRQLADSLSFLSIDLVKDKKQHESRVNNSDSYRTVITEEDIEKKPLIKLKESEKNAVYVLTKDAIRVKETLMRAKEADKAFPTVKVEIIKSRTSLEPSSASQFYEALAYKLLANFLLGLESYVRAPESLKYFAFKMLIEQKVDRYAELLVAMGHAHPEATEESVRNVLKRLESLSLEVRKSGGFVE